MKPKKIINKTFLSLTIIFSAIFAVFSMITSHQTLVVIKKVQINHYQNPIIYQVVMII